MSQEGAEETQRRAAQLIVGRLRELVSSSAPIGRRARTLSPVSAVYECSALGRARVRAGGVTRPSADPARAGHNIAMLPEVIREATALIRADPVLKRTQAELVPLLCDELEKLGHQELLEATVRRVEALGRAYAERTFPTRSRHWRGSPPSHVSYSRLKTSALPSSPSCGPVAGLMRPCPMPSERT